MLAAVLHDVGKLVLEEVPEPVAGPDEVVVRVRACGICQTDHKAVTGRRRNVTFPAILGHEPAGVVSAVGSDVTEFKEGDEVIVAPSGFCGSCRYCRLGLHHYCTTAFTTGGDGPEDVWPGAFAEYFKTRVSSVYPKPKDLSWESVALTEPLAGAWKGLIQYSQLSIGQDVVVIGVGSIGLLAVMIAAAAGAGAVVAVDVSSHALESASRLGATHTVNPRDRDARRAVYEILPDGPDVVLEAAGPPEAVQLMFDLRRRGTRVNLFGITTHEEIRFDGGQTHFLETRMDASFGVTPLAMMQSIRLQERGLVDPSRTISHRFALQDIHAAMVRMAGAERNKVMILP
ncbi:MAG: alcohol dehydrogenase catalytic domain-containing protein [Phycisphaerae bacterium]|nr:alcohol dehydrogenase catalytic domain-containing protein [Phycisphaerae bacterium]